MYWCGLAPLLAVAGEGDWPQFRGPGGQGIVKAAKVPMSWGKDRGVVWKTPIPGKGWSSPVMSGGRIALTTARMAGEKTVLGVLVLDAATGKVVWEKDLFHPTPEEVAKCHAKNSLASSTPCIGGETLYVHFGHMGIIPKTPKSRGSLEWA